MKNNASFAYALLLVVGDFLALLAAFGAAYIIRVKVDPRPLLEQIPAFTFFRASLFVLPLWVLVHSFIGLYRHEVYEKRFTELGRLLIGSFIGILVVIGYDFVTNRSIFPARLVPIYGLILGFGFLVIFRSLARVVRKQLFKYGIGISNILIIGNTAASEAVALGVQNTKQSGLNVLGIVGKKVENLQYFASFDEAIKAIKEPIHAFIQTELYADQDKNNQILEYAQVNHVTYRFSPGNSDIFVGNLTVELFAGLPVIAVHQTALIGWGRILKRIFDIFVSAFFLLLTLPLMLLSAILIKLFDPRGPIFLKQVRLTRFNRRFRVYKFRTHISKYNGLSPEAAFTRMGREDLIKTYRDNGDFLANDPRVSRVGRILRRTSFDELPQLFNVLKGDISLVGPRALVPEELNQYAKKHAILSVKSGLTGFAQISGRKDIDFDERRKLDVYYVQNWSFWLDLIILLKTLRVVLSGAGAK